VKSPQGEGKKELRKRGGMGPIHGSRLRSRLGSRLRSRFGPPPACSDTRTGHHEGNPPNVFDVNDRSPDPAPSLSLGVDLGGTHLRVVAFRGLADAARRRFAPPDSEGIPDSLIQAEHRERVGKDRTPERLVGRIGDLVESLLSRSRSPGHPAGPGPPIPFPVGVAVAGMPGGPAGFIARSPNLGWTDVPLGELLRERLGEGFRVRVVNDVSAAAWAEYRLGAGVGVRDLLAVFMGTGIGGGIVAGGRLVEGAVGCAGELGHMKVVSGPGGRRCRCGGTGCVEAYAGGRALEKRARTELGAHGRSPAGLRSGPPRESQATELAGDLEEVRAAHLDRAAGLGNPYAVQLWDEVAPLLGMALANAVTLLNPAVLILGGGMISRTPLLRERMVEELRKRAVPPALDTLTIREALLGDASGAAGAALLADPDQES